MNKKYLFALLVTGLVATEACKKSSSPVETPTPVVAEVRPEDEIPPVTTNRTELSIDSIFLYAKQIYYWNDKLPTYKAFDPRRYNTGSTSLEKYKKELIGIAGYSANKYDVYKDANGVYQNETKYSYINDITTNNPSATGAVVRNDDMLAVDLLGNGNDIGIRLVSYLLDNTRTKYIPFVTAVYKGSPADLAGVKRGWYISKANGQTYGDNYTNESTNLNNAINAASVNLELTNYITKEKMTVSLNKTVYKSSPVYASKIFTAGAKKIGYFAMARFSRLSNTSPANLADASLDPVFQEFSNQGVTDLIIDFRYNGGGYIQTAEYLMNLISPTTNNGKVMYAEHYNSTMQSNKATILKNQPLPGADGKVQYRNGAIVNYFDYMANPYTVENNTASFAKKGPLNTVQRVIFLVTGGTASASELVINSLKPYLNVEVVGERTYGKPIGFFPMVIENRYEVYFSLFESKNAKGDGGYFDGLKPDYDESDVTGTSSTGAPVYKYPDLWDDVRYDFGDIREAYLAQALKVLAPGVTVTTAGSRSVQSVSSSSPSTTLSTTSKSLGKYQVGKGEFIGMIEDPGRRK